MTHYNLINHERRLIACISPKCACTTLQQWFKATLDKPEPRLQQTIAKHMIASERIVHYADYKRVLFVRDPLRRLVSFYATWVVRQPELWCFADAAKNHDLRERSFHEFLVILDGLAGDGTAFQHHLEPQTSNIKGIEFDHVIDVDRLAVQLRPVNDLLNINSSVPRLNATAYNASMNGPACDLKPERLARDGIPSPRQFFNADLVTMAARIYRDDLDYFRAHHDDNVLFKA